MFTRAAWGATECVSIPYGSAAVNCVVSFNLPPVVFSAASTSTHERTEFNGKGARSAGNNGTRVDALPTLQWQAGTLLKKPIAAPRVRWVTARHLRTSWGPTAANYQKSRRPLIYFSSKSKINKLNNSSHSSLQFFQPLSKRYFTKSSTSGDVFTNAYAASIDTILSPTLHYQGAISAQYSK